MQVTHRTVEALKAAENEASQDRYKQENAARNDLYADIAWTIYKINTRTSDENAAKLDDDQRRNVEMIVERASKAVYALVSQTQTAEQFRFERERAEADLAASTAA